MATGCGDEMYEPLARRAGADEVVVAEMVSGQQVTQKLRAATLERASAPSTLPRLRPTRGEQTTRSVDISRQ